MNNPKSFYTMKLEHLSELKRLINAARKTLTELSQLEEEAPDGDVSELFWINNDLDSLETSVTAHADSIEALL